MSNAVGSSAPRVVAVDRTAPRPTAAPSPAKATKATKPVRDVRLDEDVALPSGLITRASIQREKQRAAAETVGRIRALDETRELLGEGGYSAELREKLLLQRSGIEDALTAGLAGLEAWRGGLPIGPVSMGALVTLDVVDRGGLASYRRGAEDSARAGISRMVTDDRLTGPVPSRTHARVRVLIEGHNPGELRVRATRERSDAQRALKADGFDPFMVIDSALSGTVMPDGTFRLGPDQDVRASTGLSSPKKGSQVTVPTTVSGLHISGRIERGAVRIDGYDDREKRPAYSRLAGIVDQEIIRESLRTVASAPLQDLRPARPTATMTPPAPPAVTARDVLPLARPLGTERFEGVRFSDTLKHQDFGDALGSHNPRVFGAADEELIGWRNTGHMARGGRTEYPLALVCPPIEELVARTRHGAQDSRIFALVARCAELARGKTVADITGRRRYGIPDWVQKPTEANHAAARIRDYLREPVPGLDQTKETLGHILRMAVAADVEPSSVRVIQASGVVAPLLAHPNFPWELVVSPTRDLARDAQTALDPALPAEQRTDAAERLVRAEYPAATFSRALGAILSARSSRLPASPSNALDQPTRRAPRVVEGLGPEAGQRLARAAMQRWKSPAAAAVVLGLVAKLPEAVLIRGFESAGCPPATAKHWGGVAADLSQLDGSSLLYALHGDGDAGGGRALDGLATRCRLARGGFSDADLARIHELESATSPVVVARAFVEALELFPKGVARKRLSAFIENRTELQRTQSDARGRAARTVDVPLAERRWVGWMSKPSGPTAGSADASGAGAAPSEPAAVQLRRLFDAAASAMPPELTPSAARSTGPGDVGARKVLAERTAAAVFSAFGVPFPPVVWLPGSEEAYTQGGQIYMGERLAETLDVRTLSQILAHEAGHVHEGHTGPVNALLAAMHEAKLIPTEVYDAMMRDDEHVADMYGAVVAWMTGDHGAPGLAEWLGRMDMPQTASHPGSSDRIAGIQAMIGFLEAADVAQSFLDASGDRRELVGASEPDAFGGAWVNELSTAGRGWREGEGDGGDGDSGGDLGSWDGGGDTE